MVIRKITAQAVLAFVITLAFCMLLVISAQTWLALFVSFCLSLLASAIVQINQTLKQHKDTLEVLSNTDALTGIHNRRYFMDAAEKQMDRISRKGGESFIIIFDLDFFKRVNDDYNHAVGDAVLQEIAERVQKMLRSYDIFARIGGEEFIIFALEVDRGSVMGLAERIRMNIAAKPVQVAQEQVAITASFGIAQAAPQNSLQEAIALADQALYQAKAVGRNKSLFYENGGGFSEY